MKKLIVGCAVLGIVILTIFPYAAYADSSSQARPAGPSTAAARSPDGLETLREAEKLRESAMTRGDIELLKTLFSDYYYHVESNGRVRSKTQLLLSLQRGEFKFLSYTVDEMEVRLSGLTAVTIGRFTITREVGLEQRQYSGRFMRVWERDGNRWRNTMHQATEVKPAADPSKAVASTQ
jgi:hypothetical protein